MQTLPFIRPFLSVLNPLSIKEMVKKWFSAFAQKFKNIYLTKNNGFHH